MKTTVKIGTRGSRLALWQARWVKQAIEKKHPDTAAEMVVIKTKGDKVLDVPLAKIGGKGLFVKELETALLDGQIDMAVHSMKDMPAQIPRGLCIGAVPERETPYDVLISNQGELDTLPSGARMGTSSLRRMAQLLHQRPDLSVLPLRGNLETRLRKLQEGATDAIILAAAGVKRMGYLDRITQYLDEAVMLPAVGQGALCVEVREDDAHIQPIVSALDHTPTRTVVAGERTFLNRLEGGCQVPIAAYGKICGPRFHLTGLVASLDGQQIIKDQLSSPLSFSEDTGIMLAEKLLDAGAGDILKALKD